ncbi:hypothetical protein TSOC_002260 [Tetrabaena socialis]|uniref:Uncharacterized protein n=1 Tax=Tetrabaena socialis TaxID=47790 RepID=A0A2J8AEM9_9CHLO|nr:hypothetical protein TSOC_002260 [Tetrabaena socialis]|eukprot:PNH10962.1 hypothetical protein TSOC_002260 [Tetrabaena socialis]
MSTARSVAVAVACTCPLPSPPAPPARRPARCSAAQQPGWGCVGEATRTLTRHRAPITRPGRRAPTSARAAGEAGPSGRKGAEPPIIQPSIVIPPPSTGSQYDRNRLLDTALGGSTDYSADAGRTGGSGSGGKGVGGGGGRRGGGADNVFSGGGFFGDRRFGLLPRVLMLIQMLAWSVVLYMLVDLVVGTSRRVAGKVWNGRHRGQQQQQHSEAGEGEAVAEEGAGEEAAAVAGAEAGAGEVEGAADAAGPLAEGAGVGTAGASAHAADVFSWYPAPVAAPAVSESMSAAAAADVFSWYPPPVAPAAAAPLAEGAGAEASYADVFSAYPPAVPEQAQQQPAVAPVLPAPQQRQQQRAPFARYEGARPLEYPTLAVYVMILGSVGFFSMLG